MILNVLSRDRILRYLLNNLESGHRSFLKTKISELKIGSTQSLITATLDTPFIHILELMVDKGVSAIPIIDAEGKFLDVYSKNDLVAFARDSNVFEAFSKPISDILASQKCPQNRMKSRNAYTCTKKDKFIKVIQRLLDNRLRRVICLENDKVVAVISLQDILRFLIV